MFGIGDVGTTGDETVLVSGVVNPVGDTVGANVLVESLSPNSVAFVVDLLEFASFLSKNLVLGFVEVVVTVGENVSLLTDDAVFVFVARSSSGTGSLVRTRAGAES